jgi:hypothetical protein
LTILHGEWSVKDLLGHLGFWENRAADLFALLKEGQEPEPFKDIDSLNTQAVSDMRKLSLVDVRVFEKTAYKKILAVLFDATDSELFDTDHFAWTGGRPFEEIISNNTCDHFDEHTPELIAWLKRVA